MGQVSNEREATAPIDKSAWGPGPWQDEPDRVEWEHAGLPCLMVRSRDLGQWCARRRATASSRAATRTRGHRRRCPMCDLSLSEHDTSAGCGDAEHRAALALRAAGAPAWSPIVRRHDHGDFRDYLDGKPIHCGTGLELQAFEYRSDDFGEYTMKLPAGVRVRYELEWPRAGEKPADRRVVLHTVISGHEFTSPLEKWMRLRWPERKTNTERD